MNIEDLKVEVMNWADKSDPLNALVVAYARCWIDGVCCGWIGEIERKNYKGDSAAINAAVAELVIQILKAPRNPLQEGVPPARV